MTNSIGGHAARGIAAERTRHGWSQAELGRRLGWSQPKVSAIERGRRTLTLDQAAVLCRVLQVPLVKLLDGADAGDLQVLGLESDEVRPVTIRN